MRIECIETCEVCLEPLYDAIKAHLRRGNQFDLLNSCQLNGHKVLMVQDDQGQQYHAPAEKFKTLASS